MMLEMYLDGNLLDTATPIPHLWQTKSNEYMKGLVAELEKKHADLLKKSTGSPSYILSGVQSCINGFTPLGHPPTSPSPSRTVETLLIPAENKAKTASSATAENICLNQAKRVA
jgi:hypothetical protein